MGVAGILVGIALPIGGVLDGAGGQPIRSPLTLDRAAFFSAGLWDAFLAALLAACGWRFLLNRPRGPWMGALCGGGVLVDSADLLAAGGPMFCGVLAQTLGSRRSQVARWAAVGLFLVGTRALRALAVPGVSLGLRGRSASPPHPPGSGHPYSGRPPASPRSSRPTPGS